MRFTKKLATRLRELDQDRESGAAMVEFVIVFPVQLVLTLFIMQFALLAHGKVVVQHAAFMGARAAAVSDGMAGPTGAIPQRAANRVVARACVALTNTQGLPVGGGTTANTDALSWRGGPNLTASSREAQAYGHLNNVTVAHSDGLTKCYVEFDFPLIIPVASNILSRRTYEGFPFMRLGFSNAATVQRQMHCFRIRQVGYCPTPWLEQGLTGGTTTFAVRDSGNE